MAGLTFFSVTDPLAKPGNNTSIAGINASGQIVGSYLDNSNKTHGFIYTDGNYVTLDFPGAILTQALGINASGQIVGVYVDSNSKEHSFLFKNGVFSTIDDPAATLTVAHGIDSNGNIVGILLDQTGEHAFVRLASGGFIRSDPPGATNIVEAHGINDAGQIAGRFDTPGEHGYVEINGEFTQLDDPVTNAFNTNAFGINNAGQVVGTYQLGGNTHGFLYSGGTSGQFTTIDRPGAASDFLLGINDSGRMIGTSSFDAFLAETVPAAGATPTFGTAFNSPLPGEFNGDALSDLVYRRSSDGLAEIQYLFNNSTIGGGVIANDAFDASWSLITSADANGDGISDLVYRRASDGLVEIELIGGDISTGPRAVGGGAIAGNPFDASFNIVASGDFNGDFHTDLVYRRPSDGLVEIQFLNGNNAVGGGTIAGNPFDASFNIVASGDFNGDGKSDLVWRRPTDGLVEIQLLNGNAAIGGGTIAGNPFGVDFNVVAVGDFNADGNSDLVWQRPSDGLVEIQFLKGVQAIGGGTIPGNPFGADFKVVGAGDFNFDGHTDLVYHNSTTGVNEIQLLNGNTAIGGGVVSF